MSKQLLFFKPLVQKSLQYLIGSTSEKVQYSTSICFNVIFLSAKQNNARAVKSRVPQYWYPHMSRKLRQSVPSFTAMTLTGIKSCLYIGRQATALNYRLHSLHCAQKNYLNGTVLNWPSRATIPAFRNKNFSNARKMPTKHLLLVAVFRIITIYQH